MSGSVRALVPRLRRIPKSRDPPCPNFEIMTLPIWPGGCLRLFQMKTLNKVFWLFGRSGAGKTTLSLRLCGGLKDAAIPVVHLDADELRSTLCSDLGFSAEAREENNRRIAEIARLLVDQGFNVVVSTMAPEYQQRDSVVRILGRKLVWIYIHAPLNTCIKRDPKGLYQRALQGHIQNLLDYPFDPPRDHERRLFIDTTMQNIEGCYSDLLEAVKAQLADYSI